MQAPMRVVHSVAPYTHAPDSNHHSGFSFRDVNSQACTTPHSCSAIRMNSSIERLASLPIKTGRSVTLDESSFCESVASIGQWCTPHTVSAAWMAEKYGPAQRQALQHGNTCEASPGGLSASHAIINGVRTSTQFDSPAMTRSFGFSIMALERRLMQASKDELVQMLLELSSYNAEASSFIHTKARSFAFRHNSSKGMECFQELGSREMFADADKASSCSNDDVTTRKIFSIDGSSLQGSMVPRLAPEPQNDVGFVGQRMHGAISPSLFLKTDELPHTRPLPAEDNSENSPECATEAESRSFSSQVHPCLHWYGTCRNATCCIFAASPGNLCLNWVRASCAAGSACSGVHRLPSPCPPDVMTLFVVSHNSNRRNFVTDVGSAAAWPLHTDSASLSCLQTPVNQFRREPLHATTPHPHSNALLRVAADACAERSSTALYPHYRDISYTTNYEHAPFNYKGNESIGHEDQDLVHVYRCLTGSFDRADTSDGEYTASTAVGAQCFKDGAVPHPCQRDRYTLSAPAPAPQRGMGCIFSALVSTESPDTNNSFLCPGECSAPTTVTCTRRQSPTR